MSDDNQYGSSINIGKRYHRLYAANIDADYNFDTVLSAETYVADNQSCVYAGQIIAVGTGSGTDIYIIRGSVGSYTLEKISTTGYVDEVASTLLKRDGSAPLDPSYSPTGLSDQYIATKGYVDDGLDTKPTLDPSGLIPTHYLPALAITDTFVVASDAQMIALSAAETGDIAIRTDINKCYVLSQTPYSTLANWKELLTPPNAVLSVNGQTSIVVLDAEDVGAATAQDVADAIDGQKIYETSTTVTSVSSTTTVSIVPSTTIYFINVDQTTEINFDFTGIDSTKCSTWETIIKISTPANIVTIATSLNTVYANQVELTTATNNETVYITWRRIKMPDNSIMLLANQYLKI